MHSGQNLTTKRGKLRKKNVVLSPELVEKETGER